MEQAIMSIISKLDADSLLLLAVLFGGWKLATVAMGRFSEHADKMSDSLESIAKDTTMLRIDMAVIASKVQTHEVRLERLESKE